MEGREEETRRGENKTSSKLGRSSPGGGGDPYKKNGLINTHQLGAEPQKALLLLYSAPQYQGRVVVSTPPQQERSSGEGEGGAQLLNPSTLLPHQKVPDSRLRPPPGLFLCPESVLQVWGEAGGGNCCETTFIEGPGPDSSSSSCSAAAPSTKEELLFAGGKFLDFSGDEAVIHTLSYDIDNDGNDFQELEVMIRTD